MESVDLDELLRPAGTARLLGVHVRTLARWADAGLIPVVITAGGHRRFRRRDVLGMAKCPRPIPKD